MLRFLFYPMIATLSFLVGYIPYIFIKPSGWDLISWQVTYWPALFIVDVLVALLFEFRLAQSSLEVDHKLNVMLHLGKAFMVIDTFVFVYFTMNTLLKVQLESISPIVAVYHLCGIMFAYVILMILLIRKRYI